MLNLDKKDKRILFELDCNARQPISELARRTGLSRDVVAYRIRQLEEKKVILGYYTIIDFSALGLQIVRLYLELKNTTSAIEEEMATWFLSQDNVFTVYHTEGKYQLAVGFLVRGLQECKSIYEQFSMEFRVYIANDNFSIFLEYAHRARNYFVEKKYHSTQWLRVGRMNIQEYDEADLKILNLLKEDARMSLLEIAAALDMTAAGVQYKLRLLEKRKIIVGYKALLDISKIGFSYYKVDLILEDVSIISSLKEYVLHHPSLTYQDITLGGSDFEFDCEFSSSDEFYRFIDELKRQFSGKIRSYRYFTARRIYKYSYFPEFLLDNKGGEKRNKR